MMIYVKYARLKKICSTEYRHTMRIGDRVVMFERRGLARGQSAVWLADAKSEICTVMALDMGTSRIEVVSDTGDRRFMFYTFPPQHYLGRYIVKWDDLTEEERVLIVTKRMSA